MKPSHKRLLLSLGAAAGMLTFLYLIGEVVEIVRVLTWRPPPGSGIATISVGVTPIPVAFLGLVAFILCLRALRRLPRPPRA
jgi:hypothetical protein